MYSFTFRITPIMPPAFESQSTKFLIGRSKVEGSVIKAPPSTSRHRHSQSILKRFCQDQPDTQTPHQKQRFIPY